MEAQNLSYYLSQVPKEKQKTEIIAYLAAIDHLLKVSPKIGNSLVQEIKDQRSYLKLIASENFCSLSVQLAMGNLLTDKYCEGFPHHRFYAGCENVDAIEEEAVNCAKSLFNCEHAYVQPHSGADANLVAFWAVIVQNVQNKEVEKLGKKNVDELSKEEYEKVRQLLCSQRILGLSLDSGGHLTHGYRHNLSAKMFHAENYHVDPKTGLLDYSAIREIAKRHKPLILLAGYSSYSRLINFAKMREIADEVGAVLMVDMAHFAGLVAGKVFQGEYAPAGYAQIITSTTHKTLRGPRGGLVLCTKEYAESVDKGCPLVLGGPLPHVIAAKAVAFQEAGTKEFQNYSQSVVKNAQALSRALIENGIDVLTGGTDNHLLVMKLTSLGLTGRQGENVLRAAGMTSSRNMIPSDSNGPWYTSGIRLGTPGISTLGMGEPEMKIIGQCIAKILKNTRPLPAKLAGTLSRAQAQTEEKVLHEVRETVSALLQKFPLYPDLILR